MPPDVARIRQCLQSFDFRGLFIHELGWDKHSTSLPVLVDKTTYSLQAIAEKRGFQVFECPATDDRAIPDHPTRSKIERQVAKTAHEHIIVYTNRAKSIQKWQWVRREIGRPLARREYEYSKEQTGELLAQRLQYLAVPIAEEEELALVDVIRRTRHAFDVDRVTKRFYDRFKKEHATFLGFVKGIAETGDREWYASLTLNRLMFIYFIQKKGFLDGDADYLRNRLAMVRERKGKDKFLTFYRYFLLRLFHEGLGQPPALRKSDLDELLGEVPYLNGGLFDVHELEHAYPDIQVADDAFERLFDFFDAYQWHLDERPLRADNEINPDVLGYIFEKYVNQKQMGAYYTKEDITGYIARNTLVPFLFNTAEKKCTIAFKPGSAVWRLLVDNPDRYIYEPVRRGVIDEQGRVIPETVLPGFVQEGMNDPKKRMFERRYNLGDADLRDAADNKLTLPTETWREYVARRRRCLEVRDKLAHGEISDINNLITYNLDICQFAEDVIENCEGPELLRAFYHAIEKVSVLDPTCGSGAFLFAALNILEPLYEACLDRMKGFLEDLERSGEKHHPEKFQDLRKILGDVARHPNRRYFILKSIIINNLYGVDIMEEAVEICKLRLFLKLVAQIVSVKQVEPLPDIDFNIRAGNTLVGFASLDEVRKTQEGNLGFGKEQVARIEEEADVADRAFRKFREMQTQYAMDAQQFAEAKVELRRRLDALRDELDCFLASEYGVDRKKAKEYDAWRDSHQPFHWFAEFYGILKDGGFGVIIGNPPYVEYKEVRVTYTVQQFSTLSCGNLYAFTWERCLALAGARGRIGLIVPVAAVCTEGYAPLQRLLRDYGTQVVSNFSDMRDKLFDGLAHCRLCIILEERRDTGKKTLSSTYNKWQTVERLHLFERLAFSESTGLQLDGAMAKIGSPIEVAVLNKISGESGPLAQYTVDHSKFPIYYTRKLSHFVQILDFIPNIKDENGRKREPSELKRVWFSMDADRDVFLAVLNSSLFYWLLTVFSDCRNLNKREVYGARFDVHSAHPEVVESLRQLSRTLMDDIHRNSRVLTMNYKRLGSLKIQCTYPRFSKPIIDKIDRVLADHFGLADDELDFIVNYDIKYRMGQAGENKDEE